MGRFLLPRRPNKSKLKRLMYAAFGFSGDLQWLSDWAAVSNPFVCWVTLCGRRCCCGETQITASCSRGGAGQLPAENVCNCMNVKQAFTGKQHACSAKALAGWIKVNKSSQLPTAKSGRKPCSVLKVSTNYIRLSARERCALSENYCPKCRKAASERLPWHPS